MIQPSPQRQSPAMNVTIHLPDEVARQLAAANSADVPRAILEMVALEGYRSGRLTHAGVMELLGFEHRVQVDGFLKEHDVGFQQSAEDLEEDLRTLASLKRT